MPIGHRIHEPEQPLVERDIGRAVRPVAPGPVLAGVLPEQPPIGPPFLLVGRDTDPLAARALDLIDGLFGGLDVRMVRPELRAEAFGGIVQLAEAAEAGRVDGSIGEQGVVGHVHGGLLWRRRWWRWRWRIDTDKWRIGRHDPQLRPARCTGANRVDFAGKLADVRLESEAGNRRERLQPVAEV